MRDAIWIDQLELRARIGVPEEERAQPQRLTVSLRLEPQHDFRGLDDRLENAVNYAEVCESVKTIAGERPRQLIETLAAEIAAKLLTSFPLAAVEIELRKFILPGTNYVAAILRREQ